MKPYKTLLKAAEDEYIINKSRFIATAAPVHTSEEALAFLADVREKYRDATHNCYAYVIGQNAGIMRYSDDGEPGGTAGLPMMEVLKARGVVDCIVVVTRYFGGILLGVGGLVRAYSHTCALGVNAAGVCEMHPTETWLCEVPYSLWDRTKYLLRSQPARCEDVNFTTAVDFHLVVKESDSEAVRAEIVRVTDGQAEFLLEETAHMPWLEENDSSETEA